MDTRDELTQGFKTPAHGKGVAVPETAPEKCAECKMPLHGPRDYHPFAACELFKHLHRSDTVEANLQAVVEYGMKAQEKGLTAEQAMRDMTIVIRQS